MIDFSIATRNLMRNRRRSFATFIALAIGTASILLFGGFSTNIRYSMQTAYVRTGGHLQIQHRDFFLYGSGNPTAYGIADYKRIIDAIGADEALRADVVVATPTLQFSGIAGNYAAGVSRTIIGLGLVAADRSRMRDWNEYDLPLIDPPFALDGAPGDGAIVGIGLARVLQLCEPLQIEECRKPAAKEVSAGRALPADIAGLAAAEQKRMPKATAGDRPKIELLASNAGGTPNVVAVQVLRAERQGFKELDEIYVMLQLPQAQRLVYGRAQPKATAIMVQVTRSEHSERVRERLQELLAKAAPGEPLAILDFRELNPFYVQTVTMFDTIFAFIFALIGTIVIFTVSNTMNTAVVERTVEVGTIRALGRRRVGVERMFLIEGSLLGVAGAVSGAVFAIVAAAIVNRIGLTWLPPGSGDRLPLVLMVWGESTLIFGTTLGLIAVATMSAWWPARRASRLAIVDALRHV